MYAAIPGSGGGHNPLTSSLPLFMVWGRTPKCLSQPAIWFQLANVRLTRVESLNPRLSSAHNHVVIREIRGS